MSTLSLPIPLILLVHLHLLEYPHANKPEYDHNVFEPRVRGLRERTKSLEDVSYFLVTRLEGNARNILATYPCAAPSDTVAFRTSLSKYLETLRHNSIYPSSSKPVVGAKEKAKSKGNDAAKDMAGWWKDVLVRKSLLEECAGERFERLLLSTSTHALLKAVSPANPIPNDLLHAQPKVYADRLAKYKSARNTWVQSASLLLQREADLRVLRERLRSHGGEMASKYSSLSTERLVALAESKHHDLLRHRWTTPAARTALEFLVKAVGLEISDNISTPSQAPPTKHPAVSPQPLPIAAAHHPANLKKLRKPIFSAPKPQRCVNAAPDAPPVPMPMLLLSERLESESRTHQALAEALRQVAKAGRDLAARTQAPEAKRKTKKAAITLDLWQPDSGPPVNFDTQPTLELVMALGLAPAQQPGLEARIDDIRDTKLPAYPPIPDLSAPRVPVSVPEPSPVPAPAPVARVSSKIPHGRPTGTKIGRPRRAEDLASSSKPGGITTKAPKTRKSIRMSLGAHHRPSLFITEKPSDEDADVIRIISGTQDDSDEENAQDRALKTPRAKAPRVNRIFTQGTRGASTVKRTKQSFPLAFAEPAVPLPSLGSGLGLFDDVAADRDEGALEGSDEERRYQEAPSMTLKEILLSADVTGFGLLEDESEQGFGDDSFDWEE